MIAVVVIDIQEGMGQGAAGKGIRIFAAFQQNRNIRQGAGLDGNAFLFRDVNLDPAVFSNLPESLRFRIGRSDNGRRIFERGNRTL